METVVPKWVWTPGHIWRGDIFLLWYQNEFLLPGISDLGTSYTCHFGFLIVVFLFHPTRLESPPGMSVLQTKLTPFLFLPWWRLERWFLSHATWQVDFIGLLLQEASDYYCWWPHQSAPCFFLHGWKCASNMRLQIHELLSSFLWGMDPVLVVLVHGMVLFSENFDINNNFTCLRATVWCLGAYLQWVLMKNRIINISLSLSIFYDWRLGISSVCSCNTY